MKAYPTRRRWLSLCGAGALVAVAGCSGNGDDRGDGGDSGDPTSGENGAGSNGGEASVSAPVSYAYEFTHQTGTRGAEPDLTSEVTGFISADGDGYQHVVETADGRDSETELYVVDGQGYSRAMGSCQEAPIRSPDPLQDASTNYLDAATANGDATDTTAFNGEQAYVFSTSHEETPMGDDGALEWTAILYVSVETGYLLGHEYESYNRTNEAESETTTNFHSFDEEFSVDLPDDC